MSAYTLADWRTMGHVTPTSHDGVVVWAAQGSRDWSVLMDIGPREPGEASRWAQTGAVCPTRAEALVLAREVADEHEWPES